MAISQKKFLPKEMSRLNLLALTPIEVEELVRKLGWPRFRSRQILKWLYHHQIRDIGLMSNLSRKDRERLKGMVGLHPLPPPTVIWSTDGTRKLVFSLEKGRAIESVLIADHPRLTLCLSTQVGCSLDCGFCLTGQMRLQRNLKAYEIVEQVRAAQDVLLEGERISSLVFMGMGEPLANVDELRDAIERLTNPEWGKGFSPKRITVSTAGFIHKMPWLAELGVNLAVSLNATTNEQRDHLMPAINTLHPLPDLLEACRRYPLPPRRRLTFEYVLLASENDSSDDATRLVRLLRGIRCKINLIPFNEFPGSPFRQPSDSSIKTFQSILRKGGYDVFVRKSRGRDILGACGQLGTIPTRIEILTKSLPNTRKSAKSRWPQNERDGSIAMRSIHE